MRRLSERPANVAFLKGAFARPGDDAPTRLHGVWAAVVPRPSTHRSRPIPSKRFRITTVFSRPAAASWSFCSGRPAKLDVVRRRPAMRDDGIGHAAGYRWNALWWEQFPGSARRCSDRVGRPDGVPLAAMLVMPPFFYRDSGDDGVMRFFDALFARVALPEPDASSSTTFR